MTMRYNIHQDEDLKFKEIPGFSDYMICSNGRIYSKITDKFLSSWNNSKGYPIIRIKSDDGTKKQIVLHRIVAKLFIPNPEGYPQVNHKDENKENNNVDNLEWCTNLYNSRYGTRGKRISEANMGKRATPILMFDKKWNFIREFSSQMDAQKFGYEQGNVSAILRGKRISTQGMRFVRKDEFENAISQYRERINVKR